MIDITVWWLIGLVVSYIAVIVIAYKLKPEWFAPNDNDNKDDFFMPPG